MLFQDLGGVQLEHQHSLIQTPSLHPFWVLFSECSSALSAEMEAPSQHLKDLETGLQWAMDEQVNRTECQQLAYLENCNVLRLD